MNGYPQGYGKIAAIEACDPNFLIYRKFAWLHNRVLLHSQDELVQLEKQLEQLDHYQFRESPDRLISRRRDDVSQNEKSMPKRKDLLRCIDTKLAEYRRFILLFDSELLTYGSQTPYFYVCRKSKRSKDLQNGTKAA